MKTPNIMKHRSNGLEAMSIPDYLFNEKGIILLDDEIDFDSANSIKYQLMYLDDRDDLDVITIMINSPGGMISAGKIICDAMKLCKKKIRTIAAGPVASMATVVYLLGDEREMYPSGTLMIHNPLYYLDKAHLEMDKVSELLKDAQKNREALLDLMLSTNDLSIDRKQLGDFMDEEKTFELEEALKYGLVTTDQVDL